MPRHNRLRAQTAITPSQPAGALAPAYPWMVIIRSLGQNCRRRFHLNGRDIEPLALSATAQSPSPGGPQAGQIQKNP